MPRITSHSSVPFEKSPTSNDRFYAPIHNLKSCSFSMFTGWQKETTKKGIEERWGRAWGEGDGGKRGEENSLK